MADGGTGTVRRWILSGSVVLVLALLVIALFPWGVLRAVLADRLSKHFERPVFIGSLERVDHIGFNPTVALREVRIPQAGWAGSGDFLRLQEARVTFPAWALLTGAVKPRDIEISGLRLALVRTKDGRTNWSREGEGEGSGDGIGLEAVTVRNSVIHYQDAKQDRHTTLRVASNGQGFRAVGHGMIRGAPVRIAVTGAPIVRSRQVPWPFRARIDGEALMMHARGTMDRPLDTSHMTLDLDTRAADLKLVDAVIEAGLFRTQPVALKAHVRHDGRDWTITKLAGTIGRSDIAGRVVVKKRDNRTKLDGEIASRRFDFDDLSSDQGLAERRARQQRIGPRVIPDTRINLANVDELDGTLTIRIDRVTSRNGDPALNWLSGKLVLDHQRLEIAPLTLGFSGGEATGRATVDQRGGAAHPSLALDLSVEGSQLRLFADVGPVTGRVQARARLTGRGDTIREAVGRSNGRVGLVVRDGALPARYAEALGFDVAGALTADKDARATLRCLVLQLPVSGGEGRVNSLIVDTSASQLVGSGSIQFPREQIAIRLTGAPKQKSLLRLPGEAHLTGSLSAPRLAIPYETKSVGNILKAVGRTITGRQGALATDADCAALSTQALR
ncbi:AsmA family protein [Sphingomonas desiccabilis]|uniref:AsmA family protein n=1 Tax=Sphingomonas desiccabilis TaxID=429134 RepID=A0A4Q2IKX9_9SPHN|nr:AsmA family protein [Sphingomonas desiccabilis]